LLNQYVDYQLVKLCIYMVEMLIYSLIKLYI